MRDSHLFKPRNRNAGRAQDGLPVNERIRACEEAHGVGIEAVIGVVEDLIEIIDPKQELVCRPWAQGGIQDRRIILQVNRRLFEIIREVRTGRGQRETGAKRGNLVALSIKRTKHEVVFFRKVMVQLQIAVIAVADGRNVTEKVAYLVAEVRLGYAARPQRV